MIPLFSNDQIRKADEYATSKLLIPSILLMENASQSIYNALISQFPEINNNSKIGIICGKGNNGGDGLALARHLIVNGFNVVVISLADSKSYKGDALINYQILNKMVKKSSRNILVKYNSILTLNKFSSCDLIVDALLGTGSKGHLKKPYDLIIEQLNKFKCLKLSVDVPSGLNCENSMGHLIFRADLTVSLAEYKTALFYNKGKLNSGNVVKGSIGVGSEYFNDLDVQEYLIEPEDAYAAIPRKKPEIHKYSAGKVFVLSGSGKYPGASVLTANAVQNIGAGACVLGIPKSIKELVFAKLDTSVIDSYEDEGSEFLRMNNFNEVCENIIWADSIAIGPGLTKNESTLKTIINLVTEFPNKNFIIDADAIAGFNVSNLKKIELSNCVFTPHHKEFANMMGISIDELHCNIIKFARKFVNISGAYLVLKGAPSIIVNPHGEVFINTTGNSGMAKFGTGDILTGILAGLIAQTNSIEQSLICGVYLHSLSADLLLSQKTEFSLSPNHVLDNIPNTINFLRSTFD